MTALDDSARDLASSLYREHFDTLRKWAHSQAKRTGVSLQTCWDDLHDAFLKAVRGFDPALGTFGRRLYAVALHRFRDRLREVARPSNRERIEMRMALDDNLAAPAESRPFDRDEFVIDARLREDARAVLDVVLGLPPVILEALSLGRGNRLALTSYLMVEYGWSKNRVRAAYEELGEACA